MALYATHIGADFLHYVLHFVYADGLSDLDIMDTKIYVPNRRFAKALQTQILRKDNGKPTLMPQIIGVSDDTEDAVATAFYGGVQTPAPVDALERQLWLADAVWAYYKKQKTADTISFAVALQMAHHLAQLFDNIHMYEVPFDTVIAYFQEKCPQLSDNWVITTTFLQHFYPLWQAYIQTQGVCDRGVAQVHRIQHIIDSLPLIKNRIFCVGFNPPYPIVRKLLDTVANRPNGTVILPAYSTQKYQETIKQDPSHPHYLLAHYVGDRTPIPLGNTPRNAVYNTVFLPAVNTGDWSGISPNPDIDFGNTKFMESPTQAAEAMAIALALRHVLQTPEKTGALITANQHLSRMVISILQRWNIDIDDSSGTPLHLTPVGVFMQLVGDTVALDFSPTALIKLLKHPLCNMGYKRGDFLKKVRELEKIALRGYVIGSGIQGIIDTLHHRLDNDKYFLRHINQHSQRQTVVAKQVQLLQKIKKYFKPLTDLQSGLQGFLTAHIQVAEHLSGADTIWAKDDGEAVATLCADILAKSPILTFKNDFSLQQYTASFRSLLQQHTLRKIFGLHPRLFIWGTLEGRLQTVDTVIFGDCNEGSMPTLRKPEFWMPNSMAKHLGLPSIDMGVGIAAHDILSACNGHTVIFSRAKKQGGSPTIPSRWWQRFQAVAQAYGLPQLPAPDTDYVAMAQTIDEPNSDFLDVRLTAPPKPTPPVDTRPVKLSMTNIQKWYQDPYQIYAKHILNLHKIDDIATDINPAFKGTLIHEILEQFTRDISKKYYTGVYDLCCDTGVQDFINTANSICEKYDKIPEVLLKIKPELRDFAPAFVSHFFQRLQHTKAMYFEHRGTYDITTNKGHVFTISGVADRIDITPDNMAIVVDYKSGSPIRPTLVKDGTAPQLALQAYILKQGGYIYKDTPIQASYIQATEYWMTKRNFAIIPYDNTPTVGIDKIIDTSLTKLMNYIDTYREEKTAYYTNNPTAQYSDYTHLYREDEWGVNQQASTGDTQ